MLCVTLAITIPRALSAPSTTAPAEPAVIDANDKTALNNSINAQVLVEGTIESASWSDTGKVMVAHFAETPDTHFTAVLFKKQRPDFDTAFGGNVASALAGAKVRIKGELKLFGSKSGGGKKWPQIVLDHPENLTILVAAPTNQPTAAPTTQAAK
jgi:hypothetical protein